MATITKEEPLTLISATPSAFARMNRIALALKGIPCDLQNEVPWLSSTQTPSYNPLEKLPVLLFPDGRKPVYDSAHIQEYIVAKYADRGPRLLTGDVDLDLEIRQLVVLAEGLMDAIVLGNFEKRRGEEKISRKWLERQDRKLDGAMRAFSEMVRLLLLSHFPNITKNANIAMFRSNPVFPRVNSTSSATNSALRILRPCVR